MGTLADLINNTKHAMASRIGSVLLLRANGSAETSDDVETVEKTANGALPSLPPSLSRSPLPPPLFSRH